LRKPDFETDGWCLESGEERHRRNPERFHIPPLWVREALEPGDFAQLIFRIATPDDEDEPDATERMWVIVTERTAEGYMGVLNNAPGSIEENDTFWEGAELPFEPLHVIDARPANEASLAIALERPLIPWNRSSPH
jgi:hypothetical protein